MRGEDWSQEPDHAAAMGSPPHARGRLVKPRGLPTCIRITPACAGKTKRSSRPCQRRADHPRMRGEDSRTAATSSSHIGSPPHARGRRPLRRRCPLPSRITPACAGKTTPADLSPAPWTDHPRMRGEDSRGHVSQKTVGGSPPHARGRLRFESSWGKLDRITPACAGKTLVPVCSGIDPGDHPRMRGEDRHSPVAVPHSEGSPPHARGRLFLGFGVRRHSRITPACAGKTSRSPGKNPMGADHPRMRGEDCLGQNAEEVNKGSPPHARGRPTPFCRFMCTPGITPACAGKTSTPWLSRERSRDHPRMRGED